MKHLSGSVAASYGSCLQLKELPEQPGDRDEHNRRRRETGNKVE